MHTNLQSLPTHWVITPLNKSRDVPVGVLLDRDGLFWWTTALPGCVTKNREPKCSLIGYATGHGGGVLTTIG